MTEVLLVEDDPGIGRFVCRGLEREGYRVAWERQAATVPAAMRGRNFSAVLLDLGLPDMDGLDLARALREGGANTPILMLTARGELGDRLDGFACGADDYLAKPFAFAELLARLAVLVRRHGERAVDPVRYGALTLDPVARKVDIAGVAVTLGPREFDLLAALVAAGGGAIDRPTLIATVWGDQTTINDNTLDVYIGYLRRRFADHPRAPKVETLRGRGYRLGVGT